MRPTVDDLKQFKFVEKDIWLNVDEGWHDLLYMMFSEIRDYLTTVRDKKFLEKFRIFVIKEKFGGLRVFTSRHDGRIYNIIKKYNQISYKTCEVCGDEAQVRPTSWIKTLCKKHYWKRIWEHEFELKIKIKLLWNWLLN